MRRAGPSGPAVAGRGRGLGLAVLLLATMAPAAAPGGTLRHLRQSPQLLDDPAGLRSRLERLGVTLQLFTNHFGVWKAAGGGASRDDERGHSASYDLFAHLDLEELASLRDLTLLLQAKGQYDSNLNGEVGALSDPVDDADFDEAIYLAQLWAQQGFLGGRVRLRAGLLEQQTVFDRNAYANSEDRQFMASFLDNNGIVPLPSALGVVLLGEPTDWLELAAGVADADNVPRRSGFESAFDDFESLTGHLEAAVKLRLPGKRPGTYRVGIFRDGRERPVFGRSRRRRGHWGVYLSLDQLVLRETGDAAQGLGLFARFGSADPDVNRFAWFGSLGLSYTGPIPGRGEDVLGMGAWQAVSSGRFRDRVAPDADRETGLELYYAIALLPWLVVTPALQVIAHPGGFEDADDAVLAALRVRVAF